MRLRSLTPMVHIILLVALCGVLYFPYLGAAPFFDKGEPREALAVQDIVQRGEWLFPLKKATDIPSKPPLFHWSAALAPMSLASSANLRSAFRRLYMPLWVRSFSIFLDGGSLAQRSLS